MEEETFEPSSCPLPRELNPDLYNLSKHPPSLAEKKKNEKLINDENRGEKVRGHRLHFVIAISGVFLSLSIYIYITVYYIDQVFSS